MVGNTTETDAHVSLSGCRQFVGRGSSADVVTRMTTTTTTPIAGGIRPAVLTGFGLGLLWLVLGIATGGTTYHLGPLLVAGVPALIYGLESSAPTIGRVLSLVAGGLVLALSITVALAAAGKLGGPSLLPFGGAATEAVLFAFLGGTGGALIGIWKQRS